MKNQNRTVVCLHLPGHLVHKTLEMFNWTKSCLITVNTTFGTAMQSSIIEEFKAADLRFYSGASRTFSVGTSAETIEQDAFQKLKDLFTSKCISSFSRCVLRQGSWEQREEVDKPPVMFFLFLGSFEQNPGSKPCGNKHAVLRRQKQDFFHHHARRTPFLLMLSSSQVAPPMKKSCWKLVILGHPF